jgi:hypothetical protein
MAEPTVPPRPGQPGTPAPAQPRQGPQHNPAGPQTSSGPLTNRGPLEPRHAAMYDPETGTYTEPEQPPDILEARKRVAEWDWAKEPRDWSSIPTNFTPEAYSPMVSPFAEEEQWPIGSTDGMRAQAALKELKKMGYKPPEIIQSAVGTSVWADEVDPDGKLALKRAADARAAGYFHPARTDETEGQPVAPARPGQPGQPAQRPPVAPRP